jgi:hypothetical protein
LTLCSNFTLFGENGREIAISHLSAATAEKLQFHIYQQQRRRSCNFTFISSNGGKVAISHLSIYNKDLISALLKQEF